MNLLPPTHLEQALPLAAPLLFGLAANAPDLGGADLPVPAQVALLGLTTAVWAIFIRRATAPILWGLIALAALASVGALRHSGGSYGDWPRLLLLVPSALQLGAAIAALRADTKVSDQ